MKSTNQLSHLHQFSDPCAPLRKLQLRNQTAFPEVDAFALTLDARVAAGVAQIPNLLRQHAAVVSGKIAIAAKYQQIFAFAGPRFSTAIPGSELRAILRKIYIKVQLLLGQPPSGAFTPHVRECLHTSPTFG